MESQKIIKFTNVVIAFDRSLLVIEESGENGRIKIKSM